jgi:hypothetical protein
MLRRACPRGGASPCATRRVGGGGAADADVPAEAERGQEAACKREGCVSPRCEAQPALAAPRSDTARCGLSLV